ncbi:MAG: glycosyltransferase family 2 protein [Patescibacteria group bacterium]|jgi:hypothetical protein
MNKKTSIIIVTYKAAQYIGQCLTTCMKSAENLDYEIIVVDNNSSDNAVFVVKEFSNVRLIQNEKNFGFAKAVNIGIKQAIGDIIVLLNADTMVGEKAVEKIVAYLSAHQDLGAVGGGLNNPNGKLQYSAGRFPNIKNLLLDKLALLNIFFPAYFIRSRGFYKKISYPDWVVGAFFAIKAEVLKKIGFFDEKYFMYMEEVDLCYRIKKAGWKVAYYPEASAVHYDLGKSEQRRYNKFIRQRLGMIYFFQKFYTPHKTKILKKLLRIELFLADIPESESLDSYKKELTS